MPDPGTLRPLLPVASAMALLLAPGVAAMLQLAARRRDFSTPWKTLLSQFADASPWRGRDLAIALAVLSGAQLLRHFLPPSAVWDALAFQGAWIGTLLWRLRGKARSLGGAAPARVVLPQAVLRWLAILPVLWFVSFVWQSGLNALGYAQDFQMAVQMFLDADDPAARVSFVGLAVVVAPLAEETFFRGLLLPLLVRRFGPAIGLALVAIGFGALHADAGTFAALAVFSVALSLAYARTGTILVPMAMHALFNGANLLLLAGLVRAGLLD